MYFPDGGCVYAPYAPCMYTPLAATTVDSIAKSYRSYIWVPNCFYVFHYKCFFWLRSHILLCNRKKTQIICI